MNQIKVTNAKTLVAKYSIIAQGERKDCMVYATASAFDLTYDQAHEVVKEKFGRENKKGTNTTAIVLTMNEMVGTRETINGKFIREVIDQPTKTYHLYGKDVARKNRVSTFIKEHSQGTYLILTGNHALVAKNGEMIDNITKGSGSRLIKRAYKVEPLITFQP
jgi:hypothetical protein